MIDTLMIFAAGRGTRMGALTHELPKSVISIAGVPILHHTFKLALTFAFKKIIINSHHLADQVYASVEDFKSKHQYINLPEIIVIYEPELLETGGAIKNAFSSLGTKPVFTLNSDVILKSGINIFEYMNQQWNAQIMDFLLLLQPYDMAVGYTGAGDFELKPNGQVSRMKTASNYNYMYAGLSIVKPAMIAENPASVFSLKDYYLACEKVYGTCIPGHGLKWYHATRPEDIVVIEQSFEVNSS